MRCPTCGGTQVSGKSGLCPKCNIPLYPNHEAMGDGSRFWHVAEFDPVADIEEFHRQFDLHYYGQPRQLPRDIGDFRRKFLCEELNEYLLASTSGRVSLEGDRITREKFSNLTAERSLELQFDALVDLMYVLLGTAHLHGFDFREGWRRVHEANMQKVRAKRAEDSTRGSVFDVVKPEGWTPPSLLDLVQPLPASVGDAAEGSARSRASPPPAKVPGAFLPDSTA